ncbi:hypothetical protein LOK49_LG11G02052 [Camellia lanceoleosa]|uniref:Uncharacterized protein n=1 Tax=Camellia lanceoleosa TaxID=1840588 RepID=A0ACC0G4Q5_9ERIC|nr:hypothetical protein LOK49_LG11G02052 [Camellia lanceoleosa]
MGRAHFSVCFDTARVFLLFLPPILTPDQSSDKRCIENTLDEFRLENTVDREGCEQWMSSRFSVPASKAARDQSSPAIWLALNTVLQRDALMNMC